jgi:hypothetical protein
MSHDTSAEVAASSALGSLAHMPWPNLCATILDLTNLCASPCHTQGRTLQNCLSFCSSVQSLHDTQGCKPAHFSWMTVRLDP